MNSITIVRPLPDAELSPNARVHWARKAAFTADYRTGTCIAVMGQIGRCAPMWEMAIAREVWYFRDNRRRDVRNFEQRMKPFYDGLKDAGLIVDDDSKHLRHEESEFKIDRANPRVEITVTEARDG